MKKEFLLISLFSILFTTSCGSTIGRGGSVKANHYANFEDCKTSFDLSVKNDYGDKEEKYSPTLFNVLNSKDFSDFGYSYYIYGVCDCKTAHDDPYVNCPNIHASFASMFLFNSNTDILVTVSSSAKIKSYSNIQYSEDVLTNSEIYNNFYKPLKESSIDDNQSSLYCQELYKFRYDSKELSKFNDRVFVLTSNNVPFESILFSKETSEENVIRYKDAIRDFISKNI